MKNDGSDIIKKYQKEISDIDSKYQMNDINEEIKILERRIEKEKLEKEKLEKENFFLYFDSNKEISQEKINLNQILIDASKEKIKKMRQQLDIFKEDLDKEIINIKKMSNSKVKLKSGREVTQKEKDELEKFDKKNEVIKELTKKEKELENQIIEKEQELSEKILEKENKIVDYSKKVKEFKKHYCNDNGRLKWADREELENLKKEVEENNKQYESLKKQKAEIISFLKKQREECKKYLTDLKNEDNEKMKRFSKVWNETYKTENNLKTKESRTNNEKINNTPKIEKRANSINKRVDNFEIKKKSLVTINVDVLENGMLRYQTEYLNKPIEINEIPKEKMSKAYYKAELKRLKKEYNLSRSDLKRIDPYLINSVDKKTEKVIILATQIRKKSDLITINYDMKNMEKSDNSSKNIIRKIAKGAKSNKTNVKNVQKGFWQRFFDKLNGVAYEEEQQKVIAEKIEKDLNMSINPQTKFARELYVSNPKISNKNCKQVKISSKDSDEYSL